MTTKYTDEQIIEYLRTLREGDVLTAVKTDRGFTQGNSYVINSDRDGDLRVFKDGGVSDSYVNMSEDYGYSMFRYIHEGVFEIPSQSTGYISIESVIHNGTPVAKRRYSAVIITDEAGYEALKRLEAVSAKTEELAQLKAERDAIQAKIDELEAV